MKTLVLWLVLLISLTCNTGLAYAQAVTLVSLEYPPYGYLHEGRATGIDVEVIQEAFRRMGRQVEFRFYPWRRALEMARHDAADGMFLLLKTPARMRYMYYTDKVRLESMALFVPRDSGIQFDGNLSTLQNHSLGVVSHFSYGPELDAVIWSNRTKPIEATDSVLNNICKLIKRRIDIFIADDLSTFYSARQAGLVSGIKRLKPSVGQTPVYVSFCKSRPGAEKLRDDFNKALKSMKEDGTLRAVAEKYQARYAIDFPGESFVLDGCLK